MPTHHVARVDLEETLLRLQRTGEKIVSMVFEDDEHIEIRTAETQETETR